MTQLNEQIIELQRARDLAKKLRQDAEAARNKLESAEQAGVYSLQRGLRWEAANEQIAQQDREIAEIDRQIAQLERQKASLREEYDALSASIGQKAGRDYKKP